MIDPPTPGSPDLAVADMEASNLTGHLADEAWLEQHLGQRLSDEHISALDALLTREGSTSQHSTEDRTSGRNEDRA